ncbi:unnamed protein product [Rodentolepis nana]|uniref:Uncharacterized protein n=1 Tax=Rodentolepis nana TaxID=102285 RepID=A0A0R3TUP7_RODNA|nr:unnamed protein product [Rodentolepis nana]
MDRSRFASSSNSACSDGIWTSGPQYLPHSSMASQHMSMANAFRGSSAVHMIDGISDWRSLCSGRVGE